MKTIKTTIIALLLSAAPLSIEAQRYASFSDGLLRDITPKGWLKEFLNRQRTGLTGHPEAMAFPYNTCLWAGEIPRNNESSDAKDWWRYEQTAYYTDGLLRLGCLTRDTNLITKGENGINYTIAHAATNGRLGNARIESLWPMAVFFRAMLADYQYTGNADIVKALERNYLSLTPPLIAKGRRHIINLEGMLWTYGKTHNNKLLDLAEKAYSIGGFELDSATCSSNKPIHMHGVTYAETMKIPMILYAYTGKRKYLDIALNAERKLERDHSLPDGMYTSAEFTLGNDIDIAHETCDIVDYTWTMGYFLETTGQARWADRIEKVIFNAGLGAVEKDFKGLQYFSSVNQIIATGTSNNNDFKRGRTWMAYRPIHETECCAGNVNRMMPNFAARAWMRGKEGAIVATLYAPSEIRFCIKGRDVRIIEDTYYPFTGDITFRFSMKRKTTVPFMVRIPEWCHKATITVNGSHYVAATDPATFVTIRRTFRDGDEVKLHFDMPAEIHSITGQGRYIQRGPLLFSYAIPEKKVEDTTIYTYLNGKKSENPEFKCWNITPAGPFNYAMDDNLTVSALTVNTDSSFLGNGYPYDLDCTPVKITIPVREIQWDIPDGQYNPPTPKVASVTASGRHSMITLVPYGCTELRLTVFPMTTKK